MTANSDPGGGYADEPWGRRVLPGRRLDVAVLAGLVLGCLAVGSIGSLFTSPQIDGWYRDLDQPGFAPPDGVFGPVWTVLYVTMGVAAWFVWRERHTMRIRWPFALFTVQLALNFAWSPTFFGLESPGGGLLVIVPLWFAIVATIMAFARAGWLPAALLGPYLAWVSFATALNFEIWRLN